jgi:hypothetical protein
MKSQMIQMNKMYNNDVEIYRKIVGFLNYSVSNWGNIRSDVTGKVLRLTTDKAGYKMITLSKSQTETIKTMHIHRIVAKAFISNPANKGLIDHTNSVKSNNHVDSLRWTTKNGNERNKGKRSHNTSGVTRE